MEINKESVRSGLGGEVNVRHYMVEGWVYGSFEFEINDWALTIDVSDDGSVEVYGVEFNSDMEVEPTTFPRLDESVFSFIKKETGVE